MKRPGSIWLVASVLAAHGAYAVWVATLFRHWAPAAGGGLTLVAAVALLSGRRWSRFLVYLVALLAVWSWGYSVWIVARAGWPFPGLTRTVMALAPGALLSVVYLGSSVVVFRHFRSPG